METIATEQQKTKSSFVTVLAWIFIVLGGFATAISILQNIMIYVMFPVEEMRAAASGAKDQTPAIALFMLDHMRVIFLSFFVICSLTLVSAIGLLKRKNWARLIFVTVMGAGILWNIGSLVFQVFFFSSMPNVAPDASRGFASGFETIMVVMMVFSALMALGFSVLFGWIIKRLLATGIKAEFL